MPEVALRGYSDDASDRDAAYNVAWESYEKLLEAFGDRRNPRLIHDRGDLEIIRLAVPVDRVRLPRYSARFAKVFGPSAGGAGCCAY